MSLCCEYQIVVILAARVVWMWCTAVILALHEYCTRYVHMYIYISVSSLASTRRRGNAYSSSTERTAPVGRHTMDEGTILVLSIDYCCTIVSHWYLVSKVQVNISGTRNAHRAAIRELTYKSPPWVLLLKLDKTETFEQGTSVRRTNEQPRTSLSLSWIVIPGTYTWYTSSTKRFDQRADSAARYARSHKQERNQ